MKPRHHVMIAVVALLAALVLFFWPRSAAASEETTAQFAQRCEKVMQPSIAVAATAPTYSLINTISTRVLSTRGVDAMAGNNVMGMTSSHTSADVYIEGRIMRDVARNRECVAPHIEVFLSFQPFDVYVAREFSPNSCAYREVLKHEMLHVKVYAEELARIEGRVRDELLQRYGRPLFAAAGQGLDQLHADINGWLGPMMRAELAVVEAKQTQLDNRDEVERLSHACQGQVSAMMGSSF